MDVRKKVRRRLPARKLREINLEQREINLDISATQARQTSIERYNWNFSHLRTPGQDGTGRIADLGWGEAKLASTAGVPIQYKPRPTRFAREAGLGQVQPDCERGSLPVSDGRERVDGKRTF